MRSFIRSTQPSPLGLRVRYIHNLWRIVPLFPRYESLERLAQQRESLRFGSKH